MATTTTARFAACCKLAKAIKVVTLVVPSSPLHTPFNEEIERLKNLVALAALEGAVVGMKSQIGCMSEDPDTAAVICDNVKGLGMTLDPSHYIAGPHQGRSFDRLSSTPCIPIFATRLGSSCKSASARGRSITAG